MEVRVLLQPDPELDAEAGERLGRQLRNELRELDLDALVPVEAPAPPPGAKSGTAASLSEWLITLSAGGGVFVTVLATLRDWLGRRSGEHKVIVTIDGDSLELSGVTPVERAELIETFVRRHQSA